MLLREEPEAPWGDGISSTSRGTLLRTNECSGRSERCGSWVLLVRLSWVLLEEILWYGFILKNVFLIVIGRKFQQSLFILIHSAGVCQSTLQLTLGSRSDSTQTPNAVIGRYLTNSSNKVLERSLSIFKKPVKVQIKSQGEHAFCIEFVPLDDSVLPAFPDTSSHSPSALPYHKKT